MRPPPLPALPLQSNALVGHGKVLRKVLTLEEEARTSRAELARCLEKAAPGDRRFFEAAKHASAMQSLEAELSAQEVGEGDTAVNRGGLTSSVGCV